MDELQTIILNQIHYENLGMADGRINMAISDKSVPQEFRKCYWDGFMIGLLRKFSRPISYGNRGQHVRVLKGIPSEISGKEFLVVAETETHRYLLDEEGKISPFWLRHEFAYVIL